MHESGQLTVAEYFAGIGLMRMGLDQAGWSTVFANDIDPKKQEMYAHQFGHSPEFVLGDVHELEAKSVPRTLLATASFPCNDLSLASSGSVPTNKHQGLFSLQWNDERWRSGVGIRATRSPLRVLRGSSGTVAGGQAFADVVGVSPD